MRLKMWKCISHRDASISRLPEEGPIRLHKTRQEVQGSGSGDSSIQTPDLAGVPRIFNHASLSVFESSRLTMISSVITHRARPRGDGAPSGAVLMALGASLPFSIIMWTTGATAQSETSQVGDEEGARMFLSDSFFLFKQTRSWFSD